MEGFFNNGIYCCIHSLVHFMLKTIFISADRLFCRISVFGFGFNKGLINYDLLLKGSNRYLNLEILKTFKSILV